MKHYLLQTKFENGIVEASMERPAHIIEMVGFADCSGCQYEVFDVSEFGSMIRLIPEVSMTAPFNYHAFYNPATKKIEFEGYSTEH